MHNNRYILHVLVLLSSNLCTCITCVPVHMLVYRSFTCVFVRVSKFVQTVCVGNGGCSPQMKLPVTILMNCLFIMTTPIMDCSIIGIQRLSESAIVAMR